MSAQAGPGGVAMSNQQEIEEQLYRAETNVTEHITAIAVILQANVDHGRLHPDVANALMKSITHLVDSLDRINRIVVDALTRDDG